MESTQKESTAAYETACCPNAATEQHLEKLAHMLGEHDLSHLEYESEGIRVCLKKGQGSHYEQRNPLPLDITHASLMPALADTLAAQAAQAAQETAASTRPENGMTEDTLSTNAQAAADTPANSKEVSAPLVGLVYRAKEPGALPFVQVGDRVETDTVVCLIEAMKMFNEIHAGCSGTISKVHFEDGGLVEFGAALFTVDCA
ncbi:MAG: hypothetical protein FWD27_05780 [Coriobacteriia bacterium]|nr:hypothetical protein [Coriobacteriia bacterium]